MKEDRTQLPHDADDFLAVLSRFLTEPGGWTLEDREQLIRLLESDAGVGDSGSSCLADRENANNQGESPLGALVSHPLVVVRCPICSEPHDGLVGTEEESLRCAFCGGTIDLSSLASDGQAATSVVDRFLIIKAAGTGGFGTVYQAFDTKIKRVVALKLPHHVVLSQTTVARFQNEARAAARLRHENIVGILEVGEFRGLPYIISDYVSGGTLAERIESDSLDIEAAVDVVLGIGDGLAYAHQHGVVHRDLSPRNILIDAEIPRIADFGLAKILDSEDQLTATDQRLGTALYMSPEQASGASSDSDGRTDIYSLGVIFYRMLSSAAPFQGTEVEVLRQTVEDEPLSPRRHRPEIPRDLETITLKCLDKDPNRRFDSADEFCEELRRFKEGKPIRSRPISLLERSWRLCKRRPLVATLSMSLGLSLTLGILVSRWQLSENRRIESLRTTSQLSHLMDAPPQAVPALLDAMTAGRAQLPIEFEAMAHRSMLDSVESTRLDLLKNRFGKGRQSVLFEQMLESSFPEALLIRDEMEKGNTDCLQNAKQVLAADSNRAVALRAASYLVVAAPADDIWLLEHKIAIALGIIAEVELSPELRPSLTTAFKPKSGELFSAIIQLLRQSELSDSQREAAVRIAIDFAGRAPNRLVALISTVRMQELRIVLPIIQVAQRTQISNRLVSLVNTKVAEVPEGKGEELSERYVGNAVYILISWGFYDLAEQILTASDLKSVGYRIAIFAKQSSVSATAVADWIERTNEDSELRQFAILALGNYDPMDFERNQRESILVSLKQIVRPSMNAGDVSAALWTLQRWKMLPNSIENVAYSLASNTNSRDVFSTAPNNHVLVSHAAGRIPVKLGPRRLADNTVSSQNRPRAVKHPFGLGMFETTIGQYRRFDPSWTAHPDDASDDRCPVYSISAQNAAAYCNWLSAQEGIPRTQWCYLEVDGKDSGHLAAAPDAIERCGYRLPTETEWEYACRAGTRGKWFFGEDSELLDQFAIHPRTSTNAAKRPVGIMMPNPWGLFDLYGNADEICDDNPHREYPIKPYGLFVTRGGAAGDFVQPGSTGANLGVNDVDRQGALATGFRVCQTICDENSK